MDQNQARGAYVRLLITTRVVTKKQKNTAHIKNRPLQQRRQLAGQKLRPTILWKKKTEV